jgi:hypothetical protein
MPDLLLARNIHGNTSRQSNRKAVTKTSSTSQPPLLLLQLLCPINADAFGHIMHQHLWAVRGVSKHILLPHLGCQASLPEAALLRHWVLDDLCLRHQHIHEVPTRHQVKQKVQMELVLKTEGQHMFRGDLAGHLAFPTS